MEGNNINIIFYQVYIQMALQHLLQHGCAEHGFDIVKHAVISHTVTPHFI